MLQRQHYFCFIFCVLLAFSYGQENGNCTDNLTNRLNSLQTSIPLSCNDIVENYIQKIAKENKKETQKVLEDFLPHKPFFKEAVLKAGLPQEFCYLPLMLQKIQQENKGAFYTAGVWNLPLLIAVKYGLTVNDKIDERHDIKKSTTVAISYLLDIQKKDKNFWNIVIAYSNSLSALEATKIRTNNNDSIWNLYENGHLPNKNCIPYFIAYLYVANFYESEQLKVYTTNSSKLDILIQVKQEVDIQTFTTFLELDKDKFKSANPIFISNVLVPNFAIQIPTEKHELFLQKEDSLYLYKDTVNQAIDTVKKQISTSTIQSNAPKYHLVQSGEALGRIAAKYGITLEQLKKWNNLTNDLIHPGQQLIVSMNNSNANKTASDNTNKVIYTVKQGDTLSSIAKKYNVGIQNLKTWNNLKSDIIGVNQKLVIYTRR